VHLKHGTSCQAWPNGPLAPGPLDPGPWPLAPWPLAPWCSWARSTPSEPKMPQQDTACIWPTRHETLNPTYLAFRVFNGKLSEARKGMCSQTLSHLALLSSSMYS